MFTNSRVYAFYTRMLEKYTMSKVQIDKMQFKIMMLGKQYELR